VKLPWAAYAGTLRFDEVTIDGGSVNILRDEAGVSNLPPGRGTRRPDAPPRRIDIRGLTIRQLDFLYFDRRRDIEIRTPQVRTDFTYEAGRGAVGPLAIERDLLIRVRDRRVGIKPVTGVVGFDRSDVSLHDVRLDTTEGTFVVGGIIRRALDQPALDLDIAGTFDLSVAERWAPPPVDVAGPATLTGRMTGAPSAFVLESRVISANARVGLEEGVAIDARSRLTLDEVTVSESLIRPRTGGEIRATVDAPFSATERWWIKAQYADLDAAAAFRLAETRPLPFGASLSGDALIERRPGEPFRLEVRNTSEPRRAPGTAPLSGRVFFIIDGGRWRAEQDHRMGSTHVVGPLGGVWNRAQATRSTFDGTLEVTTGDVAEAARYAALFGLATPTLLMQTRGPVTATVAMGGTFTEPRFTGTTQSPGLTIPSVGVAAVSANFDASGAALNATNIEAAIGSTTVHGEVLADFVTRRFTGALAIESPDAADLLVALPEAARLTGPLTANVTLGGTVDDPEVVADVVGNALTLGGQPVEALRARARLVDAGVIVENLTMRQNGGGELQASGRYEWASRTFTATAEGQGLVWRGTLGRVGDAEARFGLKFAGEGSIDRPTGEGVVEFAVTGGLAGELIDRGTATVRLNGDTALVTGHIPTLGAFVTAHIVPREPFDYEAVIVMNGIDLSPFAALAGLRQQFVTGTASLSAHAAGRLGDVARSNAFINLQDLTADVSGVSMRLITPSRVAWDGAALTVDELDVAVGGGRLFASGRLATQSGVSGARWEARFDGELGDILKLGRPFGVPAELEGAGPVSFMWRSAGGVEQSTADLRVERASLAWGALPAVRDLRLAATFDGATLNVQHFTGQWQDGSIEGTASIPRAVLEARESGGAVLPPARAGFAKLRVSGLTEGALSPWLGTASLAAIDGRVSATLDARITRASLEGISGTLVLDEADFTVAGVPVRQARAAIVEISGGTVSARDVEFSVADSPLAVTGTLQLTPTDKQALDLAVKGVADLQILSAFAPTIATGGAAKIAIGIGGTLAAPVFNGRIDVSRAEVALREPRVVIADLNGTIAMDGQRVVFDAFEGTANGGRVTLDGGFLLEGFRAARGALVFVIERAAVEYPQGLQSEANAILTLRPGPPDWSLTGEISVERSAYTQPISVAALLAARRSRPPSTGDGDNWVEQLRLNLWVTTVQDLAVDNNYGRFEVAGAVRVIGTVADPVLSGRLTLNEGGEVYLAGNTFHIARGSISFTNPFRIEPEFDIELRTLVSGTDLTLTLDGSLDRLRTDVRSSDPNVDTRQAMSMLFGGLQGEDAITLLSSELLGATGRAIGLDTLRVERGFDVDEFRADPGLIANETDPSTRLTLSKRLRPDVELILSQSLRESGGLTAVVSYRPRQNIEIRAVSRDNLDRSVALRHEITFGGVGTGADGAPAPAPRISEVTISGNPQRPVEELRARLDLDPGDAFNFHGWQRDIDRLRAVYHEANHYEVRVRGTRRTSEDDTLVALDYEIEPGPVTELIIEGHPLEPALQDEIREVWRRTTFDRFLLEEIRARVTRHLLEENFIGSSVAATVAESGPERKVVRVVVEAGTHVSAREVRFTGNQNYTADRLREVIQDAGLELDGWLDPRRVATTMENFYRSEGYLASTVAADPPSVIGNAGVLAVTITEGPRFVISAIGFPGASPVRVPDLAAATRLQAGAPVITGQIDAARERIEAYYARHGFNTAQVELNTQINEAAGSVGVSFAILEGLQQILREVSTHGATRTEDDVIRRALRLRLGTPVNLADWSQARKRLYDTNVFRQVDIEPVALPPSIDDTAAGIQPMRAVVRVAEYPVWRFRYGAQFTDELAEVPDPDGDRRLQSLGVLADLQNQNLFGRAVTAGIAGRYERSRQAASLFTSNSSFFGLPIRSSGFVFASRQRLRSADETPYIDERYGLSAEQRWRPFRTAEVLWSYRFERSHTFDPDPPVGEVFPLDVAANMSGVNAAMFFDRRDDPSDPTRGWFAAGNWEQGVPLLGSASSTGRILLQQSMYRGVGRLVLAARAQLGTSYGGALIFSERFTLGGATTVRGYGEDALGPRDRSGIPLGGDALININGEVRFPVRGWVQGVAFADAGNVFGSRAQLSIRDLAVGYGIGLRLASPFAMLRVDFGVPATTITTTRPANRWGSGRWYFGIGHIF
jgi:outer membrane protein assembly complex protein YaeT